MVSCVSSGDNLELSALWSFETHTGLPEDRGVDAVAEAVSVALLVLDAIPVTRCASESGGHSLRILGSRVLEHAESGGNRDSS